MITTNTYHQYKDFRDFMEERNWIRNIDFSKWNETYSVTLTHKSEQKIQTDKGQSFKKITPDDAKQNMRHFLNLLNKKIFGKGFSRFGSRLKIITVLEGGKDKHLHYHLLIESPSKKKLSKLAFELLSQSLWIKTKFGNVKNDIQSSYDARGFVNYITKYEDKNLEFMKDSFDVENSNF